MLPYTCTVHTKLCTSIRILELRETYSIDRNPETSPVPGTGMARPSIRQHSRQFDLAIVSFNFALYSSESAPNFVRTSSSDLAMSVLLLLLDVSS